MIIDYNDHTARKSSCFKYEAHDVYASLLIIEQRLYTVFHKNGTLFSFIIHSNDDYFTRKFYQIWLQK